MKSDLNVDKKTLKMLLKIMMTIRTFEEKVQILFYNSEIPGLVHLYLGQEAVAAGVCTALESTDRITSTHRGHGHIIAKGGNLDQMMAELMGKATGYCGGKGGSMHIFDFSLGVLGANGIVGGGIPIAAGSALAAKMSGDSLVSVAFFGDGASSKGVFHETMNLAKVWNLPMLFVCENNCYAVSTPARKCVAGISIADRAKAFGLRSNLIDGNDVVVVYEATKKALKHIRAGNGPFLLECKTYRYSGHFEGEDAFRLSYRTEQEVNNAKENDPIKMFIAKLKQQNILNDDYLNLIQIEINEAVEAAVEFAYNSSYPDPDNALVNVFSEEVS